MRKVFEELRTGVETENPCDYWRREDWAAPHVLLWAESTGRVNWDVLKRILKYGFDYITVFEDNDLWLRDRSKPKRQPTAKQKRDPETFYGKKWTTSFLDAIAAVNGLIVEAEKVPPSRPGERSRLLMKALASSLLWDNRLSESVEPGSVRATFEREVSNDKDFRKSINMISDLLPSDARWVYDFRSDQLFIRGETRESVETKFRKAMTRAHELLRSICDAWCLSRISSMVGSCETVSGIRFDAESVRVAVDDSGRGINAWIPSYLGYDQIPEHRNTDFRPLYQTMRQSFGSPRKLRSDGGKTDAKLAKLKLHYRMLVRGGASKAEAWDETFQMSGWSDDTFSRRVGPRPAYRMPRK